MVPAAGIHNALGCLSSAPEPFTDGGVFLQFCLSHAAEITIRVFDTAGAPLWTSDEQFLQPGQHQWFYDGTNAGALLPEGPYVYEITADYGLGRREVRQGSMTRRRADNDRP
jgi:hypothetical protein